MLPNKEDIVNISQPYKWWKFLCFKKIYLIFIHINTKFNLFPIAMPEICCLISLLNSKNILRANSANLTRSLVGILEEVYSSNLFFNAETHSFCGMLGYRSTTSAVTRKDPSGTFRIFISSINLQSLECMTNHFALKSLNENQETLMLSRLEFHSLRLRVFQVHDNAAYKF